MRQRPQQLVGCSFQTRTMISAVLSQQGATCSTTTLAAGPVSIRPFPDSSALPSVPFVKDDLQPKRTMAEHYRLRSVVLTGCPTLTAASDPMAETYRQPPPASSGPVTQMAKSMNNALDVANRRVLQFEDTKGFVATDEMYFSMIHWNVQEGCVTQAAALLHRIGHQGRRPVPLALVPAITLVLRHVVQFLPEIPNSGFMPALQIMQSKTSASTMTSFAVGMRANFALERVFFPVWEALESLGLRPPPAAAMVRPCTDASAKDTHGDAARWFVPHVGGAARSNGAADAATALCILELLMMCTRIAVEAMQLDVLRECTRWFALSFGSSIALEAWGLRVVTKSQECCELLNNIAKALAYGWCLVLSRQQLMQLCAVSSMTRDEEALRLSEREDIQESVGLLDTTCSALSKCCEGVAVVVLEGGDTTVYLHWAKFLLEGQKRTDAMIEAAIAALAVPLAPLIPSVAAITQDERELMRAFLSHAVPRGVPHDDDAGAVCNALMRFVTSHAEPCVARCVQKGGGADAAETASCMIGLTIEQVCLAAGRHWPTAEGLGVLRTLVEWLERVTIANQKVVESKCQIRVPLAFTGNMSVWVSRVLLMDREMMSNEAAAAHQAARLQRLEVCHRALAMIHATAIASLENASDTAVVLEKPDGGDASDAMALPIVGDVFSVLVEATLDLLDAQRTTANDSTCLAQRVDNDNIVVAPRSLSPSMWSNLLLLVTALNQANLITSETLWPETFRRLAAQCRDDGQMELAVLLRNRRTALFG
jgi:hypothetical protein